MRPTIWLGAVAAVVVTASCAPNAGEVPWAKSFDVAANDAKTAGKLVMADLYTDW